jgi:hypothetical protein
MQAGSSEWHIPELNSTVLCGIDSVGRALILNYLNVGQQPKSDSFYLPQLQIGEKLFEVRGAFFYMQQNGDISAFTPSETLWKLENSTSTFIVQGLNTKISTDAGIEFQGLVQRAVPNADGSVTNQIIYNLAQEARSEYHLQVVETSASQSLIPAAPIVDIAFGNVINSVGLPVDKKNVPTIVPEKELAVKIQVNPTAGTPVTITVDKSGVVQITASKININGGYVDSTDPDIALGEDSPMPDQSLRGQHVARENDVVTIPIGSGGDGSHNGLITISQENILNLATWIAENFQCAAPGSPVVYVPKSTTTLAGAITAGAKGVYIGG